MTLFRPGYLREGPGIDKDAPPKTGLALFFDILSREFWQILKLNLMFVISALPLVTYGAARAAMTRCTMNMVRDVTNDVWYDFRQEFKKDVGRNLMFGLSELLCGGLIAVLFSTSAARSSLPLLALAIAGTVVCGLFLGYLWPIAVAVELPLRACIKDAALLSVACLNHSLPALGISAVLVGGCWLFLPISLPVALFIPFGMSSFVMSFAAWSDIRRLLITKHTEN